MHGLWEKIEIDMFGFHHQKVPSKFSEPMHGAHDN